MCRDVSSTGGAQPLPRPSERDGPFPSSVPGWEVEFYACLDSTSLEGKRRLSQNLNKKSLIIAETQTNGQCRHDRLWESPQGVGIWASFILPVSVSADVLPQSTLVLAVAVREAIREATGISLLAKWPNDLLGNERKCCGLLVETTAPPYGEAIPLVLGVGINCAHKKADFPPYLQKTATSLSLLADGAAISRNAVLTAVARNVGSWFARWESQGFAPVRQAWLDGNCTLGRAITLPEGYGHASGVALDIEASGALLVQVSDGTTICVDSGEILFPGAS